jgi:hypothetical protein
MHAGSGFAHQSEDVCQTVARVGDLSRVGHRRSNGSVRARRAGIGRGTDLRERQVEPPQIEVNRLAPQRREPFAPTDATTTRQNSEC